MSALQTLVEMGFSENSAKKALAVTGGGGVEQAMEWLLAHADDPGINDPPAEDVTGAASGHSLGSQPAAEKNEAGEKSEAGDAKMEASDAKMETSDAKMEASDAKMETSDAKMEASDAKMEASDAKMEASDAPENKSEETGESSADGEAAKSIKCDDCGKLFKTSEEVEFHAVKSGHSNFSESTEEKKPLSEEEREQKKRELAEKIKQRRREREEIEEKEARERERKRIQMGQEIAERKRIMQEQEMIRIAEERRREKLEDKIARQKIKDQIEADKKARKEMFANKEATAQPPPPKPQPVAQPAQKKEYTTTRLQIRLPSGSPLVQEFKAKETLSAVRLWISLNRKDGAPTDEPFNLSMSFPRKNFSDEDMDKPLDVLGLVPSAVLMISK